MKLNFKKRYIASGKTAFFVKKMDFVLPILFVLT